MITALGVTATTQDDSALLSANMAAVEEAMLVAGADRIVMINTLLEVAAANQFICAAPLVSRRRK